MRICVVTGIFPPDIGGPASYVALLSEGLRSIGCEVEVVTYASAATGRKFPFPIHRISRSIPLPIRLLVALVKVVRAAVRSDVIYCNGLVVPSAVGSLLTRKPLVTKVEGDFAWERARNLRLTSDSITAFQTRRQNGKVEALRWVRNWCLEHSREVITTSRFLAKLIRGWGFAGEIEVIENAVEEGFGKGVAGLTKEECRARIGFSEKRVVVSAGRLVSWKGFRGVVLAARSLPAEAVVLIVGEGPERANLRELIASEGLGAKAFLMKKAPRKELAVYLKAADCFVLNSGYESCSHVVLEAMKMGTPVVAARAAGMPELIAHGENGFLFDKDDLSEMVRCIKKCLYGDTGERLAAEAARRLSRYNWPDVFSRTVRVLEREAGRGRCTS
jgi:glycosyltransferase involved in cell wall biosynthesis